MPQNTVFSPPDAQLFQIRVVFHYFFFAIYFFLTYVRTIFFEAPSTQQKKKSTNPNIFLQMVLGGVFFSGYGLLLCNYILVIKPGTTKACDDTDVIASSDDELWWRLVIRARERESLTPRVKLVLDVDTGMVYIDADRVPKSPPKKIKTRIQKCPWCEKWVEPSKMTKHCRDKHMTRQETIFPTTGVP